jgi:hypothetical protein
VERLTYEELREEADAFDARVSRTPDVDVFCSSSPWVFSARDAFAPEFDDWIARSEHGYVALIEGKHERLGRFRQAFEASWCLACPFAGRDVRALAEEFVRVSVREESEWDLLFLSGITQRSALYEGIVESFAPRFFVGLGPSVGRYVASLDGGVDGFLSRRSSKMRANLRRLRRRADEQGVKVRYVSRFEPGEWEGLYEEILAIERRSWKGKAESGIVDGNMQRFYREMLPRLERKGALRVLFLEQAGEPFAFVFGGVLGETYRGLQLSFDEDFKGLSPGNLAQVELIERLCEEGVGRYDLGSELDYKASWAEERVETVSLIIRRW